MSAGLVKVANLPSGELSAPARSDNWMGYVSIIGAAMASAVYDENEHGHRIQTDVFGLDCLEGWIDEVRDGLRFGMRALGNVIAHTDVSACPDDVQQLGQLIAAFAALDESMCDAAVVVDCTRASLQRRGRRAA